MWKTVGVARERDAKRRNATRKHAASQRDARNKRTEVRKKADDSSDNNGGGADDGCDHSDLYVSHHTDTC